MRPAFVFSLILILSCESDVAEPKIVGQGPFTLRYGETAVLQPDGAILHSDNLPPTTCGVMGSFIPRALLPMAFPHHSRVRQS